jgi:hypothetical protein
MDSPRSRQPDPDVSYVARIDYGTTRRRTEIGVVGGDVQWFMVQLEYNHGGTNVGQADWRNVARFDHHPQWEWGHDIEREGLHLDLYDADGVKVEVKRGFPRVSVNEAPAYCETYLERRAEILTRRYATEA